MGEITLKVLAMPRSLAGLALQEIWEAVGTESEV